jgi:Ser/Thr protein kinase RdoA (MazF antagonist)
MQLKIETIVFQFYPNASAIQFNTIGQGNINDTFRIDFQLENQQTSVLLQRLNHAIFKKPEALMSNWQAVAEYLQNADYPYKIPTPIKSKKGELMYLTEEGEYWRIFPFFENTITPENDITPSLAYEAAYAYGVFLRSLAAFDANNLSETIPDFHNTDKRWEYFLDVLAKDPVGRNANVQAEIKATFKLLPIFKKISNLKSKGKLPLRATHNDTKAGNILLDSASGQPVAIIDWDTIMPGTILSDFGDMVRSFSPNMSEDNPNIEQMELQEEVIKSMCQGFIASTSDFLTKTERKNLFLGGQWIIGEQALRFFADYLAGDVYYKIKYENHNLVRTRNQLALFDKISAHKAQFLKFL